MLQAGDARLREVPAGQRHVHHRPVGQAGQQRQQWRQHSWCVLAPHTPKRPFLETPGVAVDMKMHAGKEKEVYPNLA